MKNSLFLFILLFVIKNSVAQSYIKFNPVRSLFSEATIFYEHELSKEKTLEFRAGIIFKNEKITGFSSIDSRYGYSDYIDGLCNGFSIGIAKRYFGCNNSTFVQTGVNLKYMEMKNQYILFDEGGGQAYSAKVDANRFIIQPQILFGRRYSKFPISPYIGTSLSIRYGKINNVLSKNYPSTNLSFNKYLKTTSKKELNNFSFAPNIHLGFQVCIRTRKSKF